MGEHISTFAILSVGFFHAFEVDHLVVVGNLVTKRKTLLSAAKEGVFWGLGHTSTIALVGFLFVIIKLSLNLSHFSYFEALVGLMLIYIGAKRLYEVLHPAEETHHGHTHSYKVAYGVGLIHGLAGSGSVVIWALSKANNGYVSMYYILLFGIGSILGMLLAAGLFSLPFGQKAIKIKNFQLGLAILSAVVCIAVGGVFLYQNLL